VSVKGAFLLMLMLLCLFPWTRESYGRDDDRRRYIVCFRLLL